MMDGFPQGSPYTWTMKPFRVGGASLVTHKIDGIDFVSSVDKVEPEPWGYIDHITIRWPNAPGRPNMDAHAPFRMWIASPDELLVFVTVRDVLPALDAFGQPNR